MPFWDDSPPPLPPPGASTPVYPNLKLALGLSLFSCILFFFFFFFFNRGDMDIYGFNNHLTARYQS
ncbi:hypothetical protein P175DRAFT_028545 [Aspergillus ochraceoroseus IBT 24754]|uniref:Uncharacterized protein n=1 Tax=Aspergillus ochraceoroseus IBT 24754 TaxID=1392256 RepID=A0A2T5M710_9EURO|nr:uncharacterized protein P175DRAFT_028545 [Aspergillus ochraceoroseus IBT 24754]PTU24319.1 hypothetical protein P175DRAFT_028545 [Aspergillus ochraceoroseus IBT 24754]